MVLCGISTNFFVLFPRYGQVAHALLTSPPLSIAASFDLHVLSTPPAFVLSQNQTLKFNFLKPNAFPHPTALTNFFSCHLLTVLSWYIFSNVKLTETFILVHITSLLFFLEF